MDFIYIQDNSDGFQSPKPLLVPTEQKLLTFDQLFILHFPFEAHRHKGK